MPAGDAAGTYYVWYKIVLNDEVPSGPEPVGAE